MSEKYSGGPVYPVITTGEVIKSAGISRRDWLAGLAMQGMLSNPTTEANQDEIAKAAYFFANALIEEGKK